MKEHRINDWHEFLRAASDYHQPQAVRRFVFRGQSNRCWKLESTLLRILNEKFPERLPSVHDVLHFEMQILSIFESRAQGLLGSKPVPESLLGWWALMAHHGAPTRMLDWSHSFYIAAYFCVNQLQGEHDGAIWVVDKTSEIENNREYGIKLTGRLDEFVKFKKKDTFVLHEETMMSDRMTAQQGLFSVSHDVLGLHDEILNQLYADYPKSVYHDDPEEWGKNSSNAKFIIDKDAKTDIAHGLHTLNITGLTLFPGLDGLGRYASEFTRQTSEQRNAYDMYIRDRLAKLGNIFAKAKPLPNPDE